MQPRVAPSTNPPIIRVSGDRGTAGSVGGMVAHTIREREAAKVAPSVFLQAIGAAAVNEMVKAIIIAKSHLASSGHHLDMDPAFQDEHVKRRDTGRSEEMTAIRILVTARRQEGVDLAGEDEPPGR